MAAKARQEENATSMTPEIEACFEVIEAAMRFQPKREFPVCRMERLRFLAASDAAVEADNPGSGGFHLIFFQADHKPVSVLLQPIVPSFQPSGSLRGPTLLRGPPLRNWSFLWRFMP